ncbi:MAG: hypothetical protein COA73_01355 [Candidatus Hydrogenedentota bacterium]|nr:MAG: hypothetical protein COA73_01355 [Candidatus Hydrogenedentota bacterium]
MLQPTQPQPPDTQDKHQYESAGWFHRFTTILPVFFALLLLSAVFYQGSMTVDGLTWPYDPDAFRDIAQAQIILNGDYPADYAYKGETLWYNPLTAFLIAGYSMVTGLPAYAADVALGPLINLAVPILFFVLVAVWFDTWTALAALVAFLFFIPLDRPTFASASYSPWLFAPHITQALFYATLLSFSMWIKNARWNLAVSTGLFLGLTFLGHTAPAVLAGCIMVLTVLAKILWRPDPDEREPSRSSIAKGFALILITAFIVSLPFTLSILFRYHLNVINEAASSWVYEEVAWENAASFFTGLIFLPTAIAILGGYALWINARNKSARLILTAWFLVAGAFFLNGYLAQAAGRYGAPWFQITPGYHYLLYLSALKHILFGVGVMYICRLLTPLFLRGIRGCSSHIAGWTQTAVGLCCLFMVWWAWDDYRGWRELKPLSLNVSASLSSKSNPYFWIRDHTSSEDIFLCEDTEALHMVTPAGVKVVALEQAFSHIYLDWQARDDIRQEMFWELEMGEMTEFYDMAAKHGVTHVLLGASSDITHQVNWDPHLNLEFESSLGRIYSIHPNEPVVQSP